jgi:hypothetical protein
MAAIVVLAALGRPRATALPSASDETPAVTAETPVQVCVDTRSNVPPTPIQAPLPISGDDGPMFAAVDHQVPPPIGYDIPGVGATDPDEFADAAPGLPYVTPAPDPPPRDPLVDEHIRRLLDEGVDFLRDGHREHGLARIESALALRPSLDLA